MRAPKKSLFLILTALMALTSACASSQLRATGVEAKPTDPQPQQDARPAAAVVKAKRANLREKPFQSAAVVSTVNKGDLLSLSIAVPVGPWYHIRDSKTGAEGWIHGNTIALLQTVDTSTATSDHVPRTTSTSAQRSRRISPTVSDNSPSVSSSPRGASGRSYVNVDGVRVPSPVFSDTRPAGASARCRDGSYSFSQNRRGTCSHHGGVAEWY
jgi:SH3-like domain-containing protein